MQSVGYPTTYQVRTIRDHGVFVRDKTNFESHTFLTLSTYYYEFDPAGGIGGQVCPHMNQHRACLESSSATTTCH